MPLQRLVSCAAASPAACNLNSGCGRLTLSGIISGHAPLGHVCWIRTRLKAIIWRPVRNEYLACCSLPAPIKPSNHPTLGRAWQKWSQLPCRSLVMQHPPAQRSSTQSESFKVINLRGASSDWLIFSLARIAYVKHYLVCSVCTTIPQWILEYRVCNGFFPRCPFVKVYKWPQPTVLIFVYWDLQAAAVWGWASETIHRWSQFRHLQQTLKKFKLLPLYFVVSEETSNKTNTIMLIKQDTSNLSPGLSPCQLSGHRF